MGVELSGAWGTSCDSALPGVILCLLSLFLPSRGRTLVTSHHPAKCPKYPHWFWKMLSRSCCSQLRGCWEGRDWFGAQSHWFPHALSLSSPWTQFLLTLTYPSNGQSREADIADGASEPAVRLDCTSACKPEQNLICASYRSPPPPAPRIWITSRDSLIQNEK